MPLHSRYLTVQKWSWYRHVPDRGTWVRRRTTHLSAAGVEGLSMEHFDVMIVGAGLSGVGAACPLRQRHPRKSFAILEGRAALGGTWDLFRYPGIRSDSDMHTLGYRFKPWTDEKAIADGDLILDYVRETARENRIEEKIRYGHRVVRAEWSTADSRWTIEAERTDSGETVRLTCGYLWNCTGYYDYDQGYTPDFPGSPACSPGRNPQ